MQIVFKFGMGILWNLFLITFFAIHFTPYSPTFTLHMCAKFAALTIFDTKSVAAWVFDQVVAIALSLNELTLWVRLKGVHGACITRFMHIAPS